MNNSIIIIISLFFCLSIKATTNSVVIEEVCFTNQGIAISGSLVFPDISSQCPAIILIDGSGKTQRKMSYARAIAEKGIAVLTYDKRGVGKSGGKYRERRNASASNLKLLAEDAVAGIDLLTDHENIAGHRIGIWAGSQGGWIAPLTASLSSNVSFMVLLSSPSVSVSKEMKYSKLAENNPDVFTDYSPEQIEEKINRKSIFQCFQADFDPHPYLEEINIPVLWIYGGKDRSVPVSSSLRVIDKLEKDNFEIKIYSECGHSLRFPKGKSAPAKEVNEFFINWIHNLKQNNSGPEY